LRKSVFNAKGEVVGIATSLIDEAQNLNFAMPVNLIKDKIAIQQVTFLKDAGTEDYKNDARYWFMRGALVKYKQTPRRAW
jgi:hypothetical protein